MITLVLGTNNSGKSQLAEELAIKQAVNGKKYYIATMVPYGEAGANRIKKHRKMREGKGFETLEWPNDLDKYLCDLTEQTLELMSGSTILLECMSNLVGNELYSPDNKDFSDEKITEKIISEVMVLCEVAANVIIVTNEFPKEDEGYDEETKRYVKLTDTVNSRLRKKAHTVYELKGGEWSCNENT